MATMKILLLSLIAIAGCTYNLDPPALQDLRDRQRATETWQAQVNEWMTDIQKRQAEDDAKIRLMWQHGK